MRDRPDECFGHPENGSICAACAVRVSCWKQHMNQPMYFLPIARHPVQARDARMSYAHEFQGAKPWETLNVHEADVNA